MNDTTKKAVETDDGKIKAQGRTWEKERLKEYRSYQTEYNKTHYQQIVFRLNKETDADIIKWLRFQDNLAAYLKDLITTDMVRSEALIVMQVEENRRNNDQSSLVFSKMDETKIFGDK